MPNLSLRQIVMLTARTPFNNPGDVEAFAAAAKSLGVEDLNAEGARNTVKAVLMNDLRRNHKTFFARLNKFDEVDGGKQGDTLIAAAEEWLQKNQGRYPEGINLAAQERG